MLLGSVAYMRLRRGLAGLERDCARLVGRPIFEPLEQRGQQRRRQRDHDCGQRNSLACDRVSSGGTYRQMAYRQRLGRIGAPELPTLDASSIAGTPGDLTPTHVREPSALDCLTFGLRYTERESAVTARPKEPSTRKR